MGTPLPPFPASTHGPPKSGLKRFVTIADSLKTLERQAMNLRNDPYHQPHNEKRLDKPSVNPHVNLAKCITGGGGGNWHYSGKRAYTVRELAELQGFRSQFHFTGSITQAKRQCGNAWPIASKAYFLVVAATREAFDHGYIDEEDEIHDLYDHLEAKGIQIPRLPSIDIDLLDDRPASRVGSREPQFRYLNRIEKTTQPNFPISLALWGKRKEIDPKPQRKKTKIVPRSANLMDGLLDDIEDAADSAPRRNIPGRRRRRTVVYIDDEDEPTWTSESE
jgi:DNA (cytosine-5)-methyltransferase 1